MLRRNIYIISILLMFFSTSLLIAQSGWYWSNPKPQGNYLFGVFFTDANTGTVVGADGTILRTTTGGVEFVEQNK